MKSSTFAAIRNHVTTGRRRAGFSSRIGNSMAERFPNGFHMRRILMGGRRRVNWKRKPASAVCRLERSRALIFALRSPPAPGGSKTVLKDPPQTKFTWHDAARRERPRHTGEAGRLFLNENRHFGLRAENCCLAGAASQTVDRRNSWLVFSRRLTPAAKPA